MQLANGTSGYIDGNYYYGGRVEVCFNEVYYPVCGQGWDDLEAAVICNYYGYTSYRMFCKCYITCDR